MLWGFKFGLVLLVVYTVALVMVFSSRWALRWVFVRLVSEMVFLDVGCCGNLACLELDVL